MEPPLYYLVRLNVLNEHRREYLPWYSGLHAHDILNLSGVSSIRSYRSLFGGPYITAITEIASPAVLASPEYVAIAANDPIVAQGLSRQWTRDHSRTIYREGARVAGPPRPTDRRLETPWIGVCRIGDGVEPAAQTMASAFAPLARASVPARAFALRQAGKHPTTPSLDPEYAVLVEFEGSPGAGDFALLQECLRPLGPAARFPTAIFERVVEHRRHAVPENTDIQD